jgi:hypothetical protein
MTLQPRLRLRAAAVSFFDRALLVQVAHSPERPP